MGMLLIDASPLERLLRFVRNLMEEAPEVRVSIDRRAPDVQVPAELFEGDPRLAVLVFDRAQLGADATLQLDDWGIRGTLLVEDVPTEVAVPWRAVCTVTDTQGFFWRNYAALEVLRSRLPGQGTRSAPAGPN